MDPHVIKMQNKVLTLSKQFIQTKSEPDNPKALDEILNLALSHLNAYTIERFEKEGSKSALIYNSKKRPKKFKIILNGHLDIIPGKEHQYIPRIKGDKLYGVGSMDMKGNVATLIYVFKEMADRVNYPLALQLVTDEEIGGFNGTKYQVDEGVRADFVISGEPTNFNIVNRAKGILWVKISAKGETAHGAYPWRGTNAILEMNKFLRKLYSKYPIPKNERWITTINLSRIKTTNKTFNKIPDDCEIWLDIRYIPDDGETLIYTLQKLLPEEFEMEVITKEPALFVDENNSYLQLLLGSAEKVTGKKVILYGANGSSDARHYTRIGVNGVEFGPIGGGIGTDEEWVSLSSLELYYNILCRFLENVNR